LTKSAKSVKYHPKRPLLMQKLKNCYLLVPRLLVVSTSGATSIPKEAKLTNAHSSSTCINCLGVVASFATKIKGIITQPAGSRQKRSDQIKHSAGAHALMQPNPTQARISGPTNSTSAGAHSLTQLSPAQARFRVGQISLKRAEQIVRELLSNRQ